MPANLNMAKAFVELSLKGAAAVISGMNNVRKNIASSLAPLANNFKEVEQSALNFIAAASPQAINTFIGSNKLLAATIGTALVPQIIIVSKWIQDLAGYIRAMNPETKQQIANWIGYTAAVMGAVYAFSKLNGIFSLIVANPLAFTFLAVAAAIIKVNAETDKMITKMNDAVAVMERMKKGQYTEGEYKRSAAGAIEMDDQLSKEEKLKQAMEVRARLTKEVKDQALEGRKNIASGGIIGDSMKEGLGLGSKNEDLQNSIQQKLKEAGMLDDLIGRLKTGKAAQFTPKEQLEKKQGMGLAMAGPGMSGLGGGGATSLENAFMQNAQAALAADELQQKLLNEALKGNQIAQEMNAGVNRLADAQERAQHP